MTHIYFTQGMKFTSWPGLVATTFRLNNLLCGSATLMTDSKPQSKRAQIEVAHFFGSPRARLQRVLN
jgi:hypothetical protein